MRPGCISGINSGSFLLLGGAEGIRIWDKEGGQSVPGASQVLGTWEVPRFGCWLGWFQRNRPHSNAPALPQDSTWAILDMRIWDIVHRDIVRKLLPEEQRGWVGDMDPTPVIGIVRIQLSRGSQNPPRSKIPCSASMGTLPGAGEVELLHVPHWALLLGRGNSNPSFPLGFSKGKPNS